MTEPRRTEPPRPGRRFSRARSGLILLVVAAALLAPLRAAPAEVRVRATDVHRLERTDRSAAGHHHLAVARAVRGLADSHWRAGTPLGAVPGGALLAGAVLTIIAVSGRAAGRVRRPRAPFTRRGPPISFATV